MEATTTNSTKGNDDSSDEDIDLKSKYRSRGKKRKRRTSDSSSTGEDMLPENMLLLETKVHSSALKNNLDDSSVRKILKKVVTNDRVLALVKLQEQNDGIVNGKEEKTVGPKLTRAKVRELMKASPKTAWNLEKIELTPIKHIPVKTRPEVKALIAQELPEDEDDDEYEPTHDDVLSDDDHVLESCSDLDSQPRTPATPKSRGLSPKVVTDGPFKVPQELSVSAKRKLELEEEATIALRTRSKLSLSSTSIEHIESTFVPPDDLPYPDTDDLWNQFLEECLNPATTSKTEDDDETDPEYNVAADPDAVEEDEEALGNSIIKISKKELNDLVTELFHIMPEATCNDDLAENLANTVLTDNSQSDISHWEGKQEPVSDDEGRRSIPDRIMFEKASYTRFSIGKTPDDVQEQSNEDNLLRPRSVQPRLELAYSGQLQSESPQQTMEKKKSGNERDVERAKERRSNKAKDKQNDLNNKVNITIIEGEDNPPVVENGDLPPLPVRIVAVPQETSHNWEIQIGQGETIKPEQILIFQQQLRQHIQLTTSNFLQLYIHPLYWSYAPAFKMYLETFVDMAKKNEKSVARVCNLEPAMNLVATWEETVSADTPENAKLVQFVQNEIEKNRRNAAQNHLYVGQFPDIFKEVISNSSVFLYPHLLPPIPYRADNPVKRNFYLQSEDALIALGLSQFCEYVEANPQLLKKRTVCMRHRTLMTYTVHLLSKHVFPWITPRRLNSHIAHVRRVGHKSNPINIFLKKHEVLPVEHKLLPYDPMGTIYDHLPHELPPIWLKYLAKRRSKFRKYLKENTKTRVIQEPEGIPVAVNHGNTKRKEPLPEDFTKVIPRKKNSLDSDDEQIPNYRIELHVRTCGDVQTPQAITITTETHNDKVQVPTDDVGVGLTNTVSCMTAPITTPTEMTTMQTGPEYSRSVEKIANITHCTCCTVLRKICKRQRTILEYFKREETRCFCNNGIEYPRMTNKLKLLLCNYKAGHNIDLIDLDEHLKVLDKTKEKMECFTPDVSDLDELAQVFSYQARVINRTMTYKNVYIKMRVKRLFAKYNVHKDPLSLATEFYDLCGTDLVDLYLDFMGFLTAEQADKLGMFKHYFTNVCAKNLIKKVKEEVKREDHLKNILMTIRGVYTDNKSTACEICTNLIQAMKEYPSLAEYVFKLFPHRKERLKSPENVGTCSKDPANTESQTSTVENCNKNVDETNNFDDFPVKPNFVCKTETVSSPEHKAQTDEKMNEATQMYYEADNSSSEEDDTSNVKSIVNSGTQQRYLTITPLNIARNKMGRTDSSSEPEEVDQKLDAEDCDPDISMVIACEEEEIKNELVEWKRDEDKLILEVLNQFVASQERENKNILDIINDNHVFDLISETLLHKAKDDVRQRVLYLLNILINEIDVKE